MWKEKREGGRRIERGPPGGVRPERKIVGKFDSAESTIKEFNREEGDHVHLAFVFTDNK